MHFTTATTLWLGALALLMPLARCDSSNPWIFPAPDPSNPRLSNFTMHNNDSVVLEYVPFAHTTALQVYINCSATEALALTPNDTDYKNFESSNHGPYENTGHIRFPFPTAISYSDCEDIDDGSCGPPNLTHCQFYLINASIESCSWGPWGLGAFRRSDEDLILLTSPIFRVQGAPNSTRPTLWANAADKTASGAVTATATVNVTCPPSGIPPSTPTVAYSTGIWPPLASNLNFPIYNLTY